MITFNDQQVVGVIGLVAIISALILFVNTKRFVRSAALTEGVVVGYGRENGSTAGESSSTAVIRFSVKDRVYVFSAMIHSKSQYFLGKKVDVLYDKADPFHAYINTVFHLYFFEIVFVIVGVVMLFVAYAGY